MLPNNYTPKTIRNITLAILDMFRGVTMVVYEKANTNTDNVIKEIEVPIKFGHYDKLWASEKMMETVGGSGVQYYRPYPSLVVTMTAPQLNLERTKSKNTYSYYVDSVSGSKEPQDVRDSSVTSFLSTLKPVPYDIYYDVTFSSRSMDMVFQFLENVVPNFDPNRYIRIKEFSFLNIDRDLKVSLESVTQDFVEEQTIDDARRELNVTLSLKVEAWLHKPITDDTIIKRINSSYLITNQQDIDVLASTFSTYVYTSADTPPIGYPTIVTLSPGVSGIQEKTD